VNYLLGLALNRGPPDLCLLSSQDYRCEPPEPSSMAIFVSSDFRLLEEPESQFPLPTIGGPLKFLCAPLAPLPGDSREHVFIGLTRACPFSPYSQAIAGNKQWSVSWWHFLSPPINR
jgi:hypothetical protein